jgi:hypothetical protein
LIVAAAGAAALASGVAVDPSLLLLLLLPDLTVGKAEDLRGRTAGKARQYMLSSPAVVADASASMASIWQVVSISE